MSTPERRLKAARVCTDSLVETIISCHLIQRIAYHLFQASPEHFKVPWYNTALAPMLRDHADAAVVRMFETLCGGVLCTSCRAKGARQKGCTSTNCGKGLVDGLGLRGLDDLKNHRDVVSHPIPWHLNNTKLRKFVADDRHYADVRPALIWDVHHSIVDAQVAAGVAATVIDMEVGGREVAVLVSILSLCWRGPAIGNDLLSALMAKAWTNDRPAFEAHPDGQFPRKSDKELDEIFRKGKAAWDRSRAATSGSRRRPPRAP